MHKNLFLVQINHPRFKPIISFIKHIQSIIQLEFFSIFPLLLNSITLLRDPFIKFLVPAAVMHSYIITSYSYNFSVKPAVICIQAIYMHSYLPITLMIEELWLGFSLFFFILVRLWVFVFRMLGNILFWVVFVFCCVLKPHLLYLFVIQNFCIVKN